MDFQVNLNRKKFRANVKAARDHGTLDGLLDGYFNGGGLEIFAAVKIAANSRQFYDFVENFAPKFKRF